MVPCFTGKTYCDHSKTKRPWNSSHKKNDTSLMVFGSHSKKRPHNLVFGSFYDFHILDMFELGIEKYRPISEFKAEKIMSGTKPCIMFSGEEFQNKTEYSRLKTLMLDFWR